MLGTTNHAPKMEAWWNLMELHGVESWGCVCLLKYVFFVAPLGLKVNEAESHDITRTDCHGCCCGCCYDFVETSSEQSEWNKQSQPQSIQQSFWIWRWWAQRPWRVLSFWMKRMAAAWWKLFIAFSKFMCLGLKYGCSDSMGFPSLETSHVFTHFSSRSPFMHFHAFSQCSQMSHCDEGPGTACRVLEIHPKSSRGQECTEMYGVYWKTFAWKWWKWIYEVWKFVEFVWNSLCFFFFFPKKLEGLEFACAKPFAFGASAFGLPHSSLGPKRRWREDEMFFPTRWICPSVVDGDPLCFYWRTDYFCSLRIKCYVFSMLWYDSMTNWN